MNYIKETYKLKFKRFLKAYEDFGQSAEVIKFGKALAFYELKIDERQIIVVVYYKLIHVQPVLGVPRGQWEDKVSVMEIEFIQDIVGIWVPPKKPKRIYVLRKHPGLDMLSSSECGNENEDDNNLIAEEDDIEE